MKYIVVKIQGAERLLPFSLEVKHSDFAEYFAGCNLVSAGFINPSQKQCYGDSLSLNLASRPEDTDILREMFLF